MYVIETVLKEVKPLRGGKFKFLTGEGDFYSDQPTVLVSGPVKIDYEIVLKDEKEFKKVWNIKAVEPAVVEAPVTPSLPVTSLPETKAPGGSAPIKKAGAVKMSDDPNFMSKADWKNKDRNIELTAIFKSTIESPAYQELIIGKNVEDALKTFDVLVDHYLAKLDEVKRR